MKILKFLWWINTKFSWILADKALKLADKIEDIQWRDDRDDYLKQQLIKSKREENILDVLP